MAPAFPLKSLVLFIAVGFLIFIIIFIFVKRQILRFALKSSHVPHYPLAAGCPKSLKQEIERRLRRTMDITFEPLLMHTSPSAPPPKYLDGKVYHAFYRMKAIDLIKKLESEVQEYDPNQIRKPGTCLRQYLKNQLSGALRGIDWATIDKLCTMYEHARHETSEFREKQYDEFNTIISELIQYIRNKINKGENKKTFPLQVGDSVFYCSQTTDSVTDLKDSSVRFRPPKTTKAGFIKLKSSDSLSSHSEVELGQECRETEHVL